MNSEFLNNIKNAGEDGEKWLKNIPHIIERAEKEWGLKVQPHFDFLTFNYVAPVIRADGSKAVIKIGRPLDDEFENEVEALRIFDGDSIEELLECSTDHRTILIEHVLPGEPLSEMDDDEEATRIIARVAKKLWKPLPEKHNFPSVADWSYGIPELKKKFNGTAGPLPLDLVNNAERLFHELIETSAEPMLVHGDLHHDNILRSDRSGWLAIDPKGVAAEPAYETAAMIRNPYKKMRDRSDLEPILRRRIEIMAEELGIDAKRIYHWCLAQTVLSAVWSVDTVEKRWEHAIKVAGVLNRMAF